MKGEHIKTLLKRNGFSISSVAEMLGESNQNLFAALAKDDVKTGLVERIAEATGLSVCHFYGDTQVATTSGDHSPAVAGNNNQVDTTAADFLKEIAAQRQMTDKVLDQNSALLRIIEKQTNR